MSGVQGQGERQRAGQARKSLARPGSESKSSPARRPVLRGRLACASGAVRPLPMTSPRSLNRGGSPSSGCRGPSRRGGRARMLRRGGGSNAPKCGAGSSWTCCWRMKCPMEGTYLQQAGKRRGAAAAAQYLAGNPPKPGAGSRLSSASTAVLTLPSCREQAQQTPRCVPRSAAQERESSTGEREQHRRERACGAGGGTHFPA